MIMLGLFNKKSLFISIVKICSLFYSNKKAELTQKENGLLLQQFCFNKNCKIIVDTKKENVFSSCYTILTHFIFPINKSHPLFSNI